VADQTSADYGNVVGVALTTSTMAVNITAQSYGGLIA